MVAFPNKTAQPPEWSSFFGANTVIFEATFTVDDPRVRFFWWRISRARSFHSCFNIIGLWIAIAAMAIGAACGRPAPFWVGFLFGAFVSQLAHLYTRLRYGDDWRDQ